MLFRGLRLPSPQIAGPVSPPGLVSAPVISGTATQGQTLTVTAPAVWTGSPTVTGQWYREPGAAPSAPTHWRVRANTNSHGSFLFWQVSEVQFRMAAGVPETHSGGTAFATSVSSTNVAANAFDGDTGTNWQSDGAGYPHAVGYGFATGRTPVELAITNSSNTNLTASSITIQSGSSTSGPWTDVVTHSSIPAWSALETKTFTIP